MLVRSLTVLQNWDCHSCGDCCRSYSVPVTADERRRIEAQGWEKQPDFQNVPRWNYAIEQTRKLSPGPVGVGTAYRQTRTIPRRTEEGFEVTDFEPLYPFFVAICRAIAGDRIVIVQLFQIALSADGHERGTAI